MAWMSNGLLGIQAIAVLAGCRRHEGVTMLSIFLLLTGTISAANPYGKADDDLYGKNNPLLGGRGIAWEDKTLRIGDPVSVGGVTVYPVIDEAAPKHVFTQTMGLASAMASGQLSIMETGDESYASLQMTNHSKQPIYVMAGEVIRGGRQDRMITDDVVIPPEEVPLMVDVHCVERGRWSDTASTFQYGGRAEHSLREVLEDDGGQDRTWEVVAALNTARGAAATGAYVSMGGEELLEYRQQLRVALADEDQVVGAVVAHNGELVHAEMFGDPTQASIARAVALDGYALDATVMSDEDMFPPDDDQVEAFLYSQLQ